MTRIPLDGGESSQVVAPRRGAVANVASDSTHVYWSEWGTCGIPDSGAREPCIGNLYGAPFDGGAPITLASSGPAVGDMVADGTDVYWIAPSGIMRASLDGGEKERAVPSERPPTGLALDPTHLYWTTDEGDVMVAPKRGGVAKTLASRTSGLDYGRDIRALVVDSAHAFWAGASHCDLVSAPLASGPARLAWTYPKNDESPGACGEGIATAASDSLSVYWVENTPGEGSQLMKLPANGGRAVTLLSGLRGGVVLGTDSASVYWAEFREGEQTTSIRKLTPK